MAQYTQQMPVGLTIQFSTTSRVTKLSHGDLNGVHLAYLYMLIFPQAPSCLSKPWSQLVNPSYTQLTLATTFLTPPPHFCRSTNPQTLATPT